ncbi:nitroreductase family protein [Symbiobacterium thermophilum]|uniref:Nitroreductase n=1 Tax=Symbiobacterium thermophilum TaxID=2734 RepID=A0A953I427_SYMTR|nr:nitroreductase family protein [Symbiobacterium thermophilum]MBY6277185.1 nitroreductase [Symbiobacterium thermophilum]
MEFQELYDLVRTRRSIRRYRPDDVPDEMLRRAIEVATWAPSGGNYQPWRFTVVKNRELIGQIADAVEARSRLMASWPEADRYREQADRWIRTSAFFRDAPACIAVQVGGYQSVADRLLAARGPQDPAAAEMMEWRRFGSSRIQTIGGVIMLLLLALHQQGLGACWMAGPLQAKAEIEKLLNVPEGWEFVALIPVGFPAEEREGAPRRPLDEVMEFIR